MVSKKFEGFLRQPKAITKAVGYGLQKTLNLFFFFEGFLLLSAQARTQAVGYASIFFF